jgi:hypothetical protein
MSKNQIFFFRFFKRSSPSSCRVALQRSTRHRPNPEKFSGPRDLDSRPSHFQKNLQLIHRTLQSRLWLEVRTSPTGSRWCFSQWRKLLIMCIMFLTISILLQIVIFSNKFWLFGQSACAIKFKKTWLKSWIEPKFQSSK